MATDDFDPEKTPTATPNAKKSSGEWKLNLAAAPCGRAGCGHRRDLHATKDGGSHRWACSQCRCHEFFIGGAEILPDYSTLADTDPSPSSK